MAVTVSGTSITFNDATVQTTAASVTASAVATATASIAVDAVGSYAFLSRYHTGGGIIQIVLPPAELGGRWEETR